MKIHDQLLKTFLDLIKIDEIYEQENEVISYVKNRLDELEIIYKTDSFGNLVGYMPGIGEPIMLNTHLDIPENVPNLDYVIENDIIRSTGKSILGADPKSGLAVLLELAKYIKKNHIKTAPIEFVFTRGEEAGLLGALHLDMSLISSKMGLVIDEDGPCTNIVTQAPGYYRIDIEILGKIVHPRDWKEGINALEIAARALVKLRQGEIIKGVTFNIGQFTSGTARNTVPGRATLRAELRSYDMKKLAQQGKKVISVFQKEVNRTKATIIIDEKIEFRSYKLTKNHPLFKKLEKCYKINNLTPIYYPTYGGSDANVFNTKGVTAVPIGSAYYLAHQYEEYVSIKDMENLLHFLLTFAKEEK